MKKYVCSWIGPQSDNDIMFGQINAKARKSSIKNTIELYCQIHSDNIEIFEHYVTTAGGIIIWFRTQSHIASAIYRAAPRIHSQFVQIRTYILEMAPERKKYLDKLLMTFKDEKEKNLWYIFKNREVDLEALLKNAASNAPYRRINIEALGAVPSLKFITGKEKVPNEVDEDSFIAAGA